MLKIEHKIIDIDGNALIKIKSEISKSVKIRSKYLHDRKTKNELGRGGRRKWTQNKMERTG